MHHYENKYLYIFSVTNETRVIAYVISALAHMQDLMPLHTHLLLIPSLHLFVLHAVVGIRVYPFKDST
jgi:hypothetical protein